MHIYYNVRTGKILLLFIITYEVRGGVTPPAPRGKGIERALKISTRGDRVTPRSRLEVRYYIFILPPPPSRTFVRSRVVSGTNPPAIIVLGGPRDVRAGKETNTRRENLKKPEELIYYNILYSAIILMCT